MIIFKPEEIPGISSANVIRVSWINFINPVLVLLQSFHQATSDEAGAAGNQDFHGASCFSQYGKSLPWHPGMLHSLNSFR